MGFALRSESTARCGFEAPAAILPDSTFGSRDGGLRVPAAHAHRLARGLVAGPFRVVPVLPLRHQCAAAITVLQAPAPPQRLCAAPAGMPHRASASSVRIGSEPFRRVPCCCALWADSLRWMHRRPGCQSLCTWDICRLCCCVKARTNAGKKVRISISSAVDGYAETVLRSFLPTYDKVPALGTPTCPGRITAMAPQPTAGRWIPMQDTTSPVSGVRRPPRFLPQLKQRSFPLRL